MNIRVKEFKKIYKYERKDGIMLERYGKWVNGNSAATEKEDAVSYTFQPMNTEIRGLLKSHW